MIGGESMLNVWKSYWAFTNLKYKLIMLLLFPILLVVININVYQYEIGVGFESFLLLYWIDVISDHHFMGGLYQKGNTALDFMHGSSRFRKMIQEVSIVDAIRRVVLYQVPYITLLWCSMGNTEAMEACHQISFIPLVAAIIVQITVLIRREYGAGEHNGLSIGGGYICFLVIFGLIGWIGDMAGGNFVPVNVVLVVLIVATLVGTAWYTNKKVGEGYYD